ncbi:putative zinc finger/helix-turn-helix protein, YgiT family [Hartmannibacter diazotrophicus]|uniref:Putative zinc finger/helix-turn-helix protein, YgiT family n=1 Tax=Hartmannibacter diazotrophicus TaxID=1482074 RepID=A0A2C9DAP1_9HYPH|nr:helix-turn-helix transcriptional regulator [Hartmannibacter diazotrophicus]SON57357.1 putative zinc finger/helix-turn-helix protein, YgiT family [Hartmannibacter diazotrophicus]
MTTLPLYPKPLGSALRRWRTLNRVKQAALAETLGVSQTTVCRWESGAVMPSPQQVRHLSKLLTARPEAAADKALLDLVAMAHEPVHLVCDLTHRLLAASPARMATWRIPLADLLGVSLWRFASEGIRAGETRLEEAGWYKPVAPALTIMTERAEFPELTIRAGEIRLARIPLSDGSYARLVRDGARIGPE